MIGQAKLKIISKKIFLQIISVTEQIYIHKKQSKFNWLTPTTKIETIYPLDSELYWKNVIRKVELVDGMKWKISGNLYSFGLSMIEIPVDFFL